MKRIRILALILALSLVISPMSVLAATSDGVSKTITVGQADDVESSFTLEKVGKTIYCKKSKSNKKVSKAGWKKDSDGNYYCFTNKKGEVKYLVYNGVLYKVNTKGKIKATNKTVGTVKTSKSAKALYYYNTNSDVKRIAGWKTDKNGKYAYYTKANGFVKCYIQDGQLYKWNSKSKKYKKTSLKKKSFVVAQKKMFCVDTSSASIITTQGWYNGYYISSDGTVTYAIKNDKLYSVSKGSFKQVTATATKYKLGSDNVYVYITADGTVATATGWYANNTVYVENGVVTYYVEDNILYQVTASTITVVTSKAGSVTIGGVTIAVSSSSTSSSSKSKSSNSGTTTSNNSSSNTTSNSGSGATSDSSTSNTTNSTSGSTSNSSSSDTSSSSSTTSTTEPTTEETTENPYTYLIGTYLTPTIKENSTYSGYYLLNYYFQLTKVIDVDLLGNKTVKREDRGWTQTKRYPSSTIYYDYRVYVWTREEVTTTGWWTDEDYFEEYGTRFYFDEYTDENGDIIIGARYLIWENKLYEWACYGNIYGYWKLLTDQDELEIGETYTFTTDSEGYVTIDYQYVNETWELAFTSSCNMYSLSVETIIEDTDDWNYGAYYCYFCEEVFPFKCPWDESSSAYYSSSTYLYYKNATIAFHYVTEHLNEKDYTEGYRTIEAWNEFGIYYDEDGVLYLADTSSISTVLTMFRRWFLENYEECGLFSNIYHLYSPYHFLYIDAVDIYDPYTKTRAAEFARDYWYSMELATEESGRFYVMPVMRDYQYLVCSATTQTYNISTTYDVQVNSDGTCIYDGTTYESESVLRTYLLEEYESKCCFTRGETLFWNN